MNKKQFRRHLARNPVLAQWLKQNESLIQKKPEIMAYIIRHPNGLSHFRSGQTVDNERLSRNAQQFMKEFEQERSSRKRGRLNQDQPAKGEKGEKVEKQKSGRGGLFSNLKNIFPFQFPALGAPTLPVHATKIPSLRPPTLRPPTPTLRPPVPGQIPPFPGRITAQHSPAVKSKRKSPLRLPSLPKINISRAKLLETMSQTTEMLDVISALMGKLGNMK